MEDHLRNPAGRLWSLLEAFRLGPGDRRIDKALMDYLKVEMVADTADTITYYRAIADVLQLPGQARQAIEAAPPTFLPLDKLLRPLDPIAGQLLAYAQGNSPVHVLVDPIDAGLMSDLETASHVVNASASEPVLTESQLDTITRLAAEIRELTLNDPDLDPEFKTVLLRAVAFLTDAVGHYRIGGTRALVDEMDRLIGYFVMHEKKRPPAGNQTMKTVSKLFGILITVSAVIDSPAMISDGVNYLQDLLQIESSVVAPSGPSEPPAIAEGAH